MKRGYKRLLLFECIIFSILILNSFVSSILEGYHMAIFLVLVLLLFKLFFGFEKDRHRFTKDIIFEVIIFLLIFFLLYYLFGILIGFAKTNNYYTLEGLNTYIFPLILTIVLKEILRYMILKKAEGNKFLLILTVILFILFDITIVIHYTNFKINWNIFLFFALTLLPAISTNIACTYITGLTGYKPMILYQLVYELHRYLLPIVPNLNEYLTAIMDLVIPAMLAFRIYRFQLQYKEKDITQDDNKKRLLPLIFPTIFVVVIVYLTSGYFHFHAIAVASGSMSPNVHKGDVVIIEKLDKKYDTLKEGVILAYRYNDIVVVHRLIRIVKDNNHYYFYTKGDANEKEDNWVIKEDMVIGTVRYKIPYIGIPTVWLSEI